MARNASVEARFSYGRRATRSQRPAATLALSLPLENVFGTSERNGGKEMAVRIVLQVVGVAADPDPVFNLAVVGFNVFIGDRPVGTDAVMAGSLEVPRTEAQRNKSPVERLAANGLRAHPHELFAGVGIFELIHKMLFVPLVGGVVIHGPLRRPDASPEGKVIWLAVMLKIRGDIELGSALEHKDLQPLQAQFGGRHAPGSA